MTTLPFVLNKNLRFQFRLIILSKFCRVVSPRIFPAPTTFQDCRVPHAPFPLYVDSICSKLLYLKFVLFLIFTLLIFHSKVGRRNGINGDEKQTRGTWYRKSAHKNWLNTKENGSFQFIIFFFHFNVHISTRDYNKFVYFGISSFLLLLHFCYQSHKHRHVFQIHLCFVFIVILCMNKLILYQIAIDLFHWQK